MWRCTNISCQAEIEDNVEICPNCGRNKKGEIKNSWTANNFNDGNFNNKKISTNNKYPALTTVAAILKIFAVIVIIVAVIILVISISKGGEVGATTGIITIVVGAIIGLLLLATSELIKVFIDIEYNTRKK
jgi:uncharacterized membrane protein YvbJ